MSRARNVQARQERALARLTARIADYLAEGRTVTASMRREYNALKSALSLEGRI